MGAQANAAPVIIKRKKVVGGGGHHGGAWKVAYADFVTAMMAFFMLMWLLNATTEQQRKGLADYFTPTIPINRISGGGDGAFGGDSIFSEMTLPQNGTGGTETRTAQEQNARGDTGAETTVVARETDELRAIEEALVGRGGETQVMENLMRHIVTRITDEGLVIELFELEQVPLFEEGTDTPTQLLKDLVTVISSTAKAVSNDIAVGGHVAASPIVIAQSPAWEMSERRATRIRLMLGESEISAKRVMRVTGHADREPVLSNTMAKRNNRVEIILLRDTSRD
ncbi:Chemotaxis protein MotB [Sulfitobacter noctilucicola]|uniref:Chemotaxis protein MotB n=1 Tax=Sulfitobacter noctilucicola TaxID=1342301 RepID=A0A7W6Q420_9RHOB|nr:flagellar motor protein MotB [Sulfitobacter noctilucicola]KIN63011.1 Chemotaxis protein MotB [Sulfitobacter noctilucicola]MBB4172462.1 chemotaxis protein MotB [Sulfitobacter noctilucicola]